MWLALYEAAALSTKGTLSPQFAHTVEDRSLLRPVQHERSKDDQYVLAHIVMHASREGDLARDVFMTRVLPQR